VRLLELELRRIETKVGVGHTDAEASSDGTSTSRLRFTTTIAEMLSGTPELAALGLKHFLCVPPTWALPSLAMGVEAIAAEIEACGSADAREALQYVLHSAAGSSARRFINSSWARDCDASGVRADRLTATGEGMTLSDFVAHPRARIAQLSAVHVLALRLYTTAAFLEINAPMRDRERVEAHPFPVTVGFIKEAISQMRQRRDGRATQQEPPTKESSTPPTTPGSAQVTKP
jgi:hypothetical protein